MTDAIITPSVLTWARERRNLAVEDLASRVNVKPAAVLAWEFGERRPTFRQAVNAAKALRVPIGYLYLSEPPDLQAPLPDFRTPPGQPLVEPSPNLLDVIVDVLGKQEWYREYLAADTSDALSFVGKFSVDNAYDELARDIRNVIGVEDARRKARNSDEFVRELARNAEAAGILVMRSGVVRNDNSRKLDPNEFRGFSISDPFAPVVFVNARDWKNAQVFTLIHELAHIWIGEGGISCPYYGPLAQAAEDGIERFCDSVAAETLVPIDGFSQRWQSAASDIDVVQAVARQYKVSGLVILRRAFDLGFIGEDIYWRSRATMIEQSLGFEPPGEGGGNFHYTLLARNGSQFTGAVISSAAQGNLLLSEAADMLGVNVRTLSLVARHNFGSPLGLA